MPRYELMYILGSNVADDQVDDVAGLITTAATDLGATDIAVEQLGKKKLAYTIKKTKNGFYTVIAFNMDPLKVKELDAKIRSQTGTIIRYLIVNLDEHIRRSARDSEIQAKLLANRPARMIAEETDGPEVKKPAKPAKPPVEINSEELEKKIEEALTEDITK